MTQFNSFHILSLLNFNKTGYKCYVNQIELWNPSPTSRQPALCKIQRQSEKSSDL